MAANRRYGYRTIVANRSQGIPMEDLRLVAKIGPCNCQPKGEPHFTHCPHVNHQISAVIRVFR